MASSSRKTDWPVSNQWLISDKRLPSVKYSRRFEGLAKTLMMTPRRFAPDSVLLVRAAFRAIASERAVPRALVGLEGDQFSFDFHWCDNPADLEDAISLCLNGDSAPNRRFNYRCIWRK